MASLEESYDAVLFEILKKEGEIEPFMDVIFGFLYRRTDFYKTPTFHGGKMGFPPGIAQKIAYNVFKKYEAAARKDEEKCLQQMEALQMRDENVASVVEVETQQNGTRDPKPKYRSSTWSGDSYNGANRDAYSWSQTANDLDVRIKIPADVVTGKSVKVDMTHNHLAVHCLDNETGHWKMQVDGSLAHRINVDKSVWTLTPGECILACLEKVNERYWDSLLLDEPKINVQEIDAVTNIDDLPDDQHAKVDELIYNRQQKLLGKPTTEQMERNGCSPFLDLLSKVNAILQDAWDKDGSPFKGQPFDPSIVTVCGSTDELAKFHGSSS